MPAVHQRVRDEPCRRVESEVPRRVGQSHRAKHRGRGQTCLLRPAALDRTFRCGDLANPTMCLARLASREGAAVPMKQTMPPTRMSSAWDCDALSDAGIFPQRIESGEEVLHSLFGQRCRSSGSDGLMVAVALQPTGACAGVGRVALATLDRAANSRSRLSASTTGTYEEIHYTSAVTADSYARHMGTTRVCPGHVQGMSRVSPGTWPRVRAPWAAHGEYHAPCPRLLSHAISEDFPPPDAFAPGVDRRHRNSRGWPAGVGGGAGTATAWPHTDGFERAGFRRGGRWQEG